MNHFHLFRKRFPVSCRDEFRDSTAPDLYLTLCEKCGYGDRPEDLNQYERNFYLVQKLKNEVSHGGFAP